MQASFSLSGAITFIVGLTLKSRCLTFQVSFIAPFVSTLKLTPLGFTVHCQWRCSWKGVLVIEISLCVVWSFLEVSWLAPLLVLGYAAPFFLSDREASSSRTTWIGTQGSSLAMWKEGVGVFSRLPKTDDGGIVLKALVRSFRVCIFDSTIYGS
jgi:hypothetical protein